MGDDRTIYTVSEVFVPGGLLRLTYVARKGIEIRCTKCHGLKIKMAE